MKKLFLVICFLNVSLIVAAQSNVRSLNGYKYIYIAPIAETDGSFDRYGIAPFLNNLFINARIPVLNANNPPQEVVDDPCLVLTCFVTYTFCYNCGGITVTLQFTDCLRQNIYSTTGKQYISNANPAYFHKATTKAFSEIAALNYHYNPSLTPKMTYPEVEQTTETEESLKAYYSGSEISPIEGIYKSYQSDNLSHYKIGIKKRDNQYIAVIIEAQQNQIWKQGEVKGYFEPSSMKGFYSVKWYMGNKVSQETFAILENGITLSIEFKHPQTGEKTTSQFIKIYPSVEVEESINSNPKSSGSGFFLTSDGIIATNAHVVEDAAKLKIQIFNEIGNFEYAAKVLLVDSKNDVALIKIDDETFKGLSHIPYSIIEKADIGEKAFTIGFPLNDVMGSNYKVTDGIISSVSGIEDDVRYYQISVPLQPGNSGGPLFNSAGDIIGITSARLNSQAVGTEVENVNYAIKISYLLNLYNMLPNSVKLNTNPTQSTRELRDQVKILKNYVCLIKVN